MNHSMQRMVRTNDYALVRTFHPGCSPLEDRYLFDMQADPNQAHNIIGEEPAILAEMERLYAEWWHGWCTGPEAVIDPMHIQTPTFEYFPVEQMEARLRYLGREDQLHDLRDRLANSRRTHPATQLGGSRY